MKRLLAGDLKHRIEILRAEPSDDQFATVASEPQSMGKRWAKKTDASDGERIAAAQGSALTARFLLRWDVLSTSIKSTDRIVYNGVVYEVTGSKEALGFHEAIEVTTKTLKP